MRSLPSLCLTLRHLEHVLQQSHPSKVAVLCARPEGSREVRSLIASYLDINSYEIQCFAQSSFWAYLSGLRAQATGRPKDSAHSSLSSRQLLHSLMWELPLDTFRPANNPEKYMLQLDEYFRDLSIAGISPERYLSWSSSLADSGDPKAAVHMELSAAYKAWIHAKQSMRVSDLPQQVFDMLTQQQDGVSFAWTSLLRSEVHHMVLPDADRLSPASLLLLRKLFTGPAPPEEATSTEPGPVIPRSVFALTDSGLRTPTTTSSREALQSLVLRAAHKDGDTGKGYAWRLVDVNSPYSTCSPPVLAAYEAGIRAVAPSLSPSVPGAPTPKAPRRKASAATNEKEAQTAESALPAYLLDILRPASLQTAPAGKGQSTPTEFAECIGISAGVSEPVAIAKTVKWLCDDSPSGRTVAVLCRSTTAVREYSEAIRAEMGDRLAGYSYNAPIAEGRGQDSDRATDGLGKAPVRMYAETRGSLARIPEIRLLLGVLGLLSDPTDGQHWYTVACSPVYGIPPYVVSKWVKAAAADPSHRGVTWQVEAHAVPLKTVRAAMKKAAKAAKVQQQQQQQEQGHGMAGREMHSAASSTVVTTTAAISRAVTANEGAGRSASRAGSGVTSAAAESDEYDSPGLPLPGSGGEVAVWGLTETSGSDTEAEVSASIFARRGSLARSSVPAPLLATDTQTKVKERSASGVATALMDMSVSTTTTVPGMLAEQESLHEESAVLDMADHTIAFAARRLLDDLQAVHAASVSKEAFATPTVMALRAFLRRSGLEKSLIEPRTSAEMDASVAVTKLLEVAHALESPDAPQSEIRQAAKRILSQRKANNSLDADRKASRDGVVASTAHLPLQGLPSVVEALLTAAYRGDLGLGLSFSAGTDGAGLSLSSSAGQEDDDAEVIDVLPVPSSADVADPGLALLLPPGPAVQDGDGVIASRGVGSAWAKLQVELGASAADAACQQSFEQVLFALRDKSSLSVVDTMLQPAVPGQAVQDRMNLPLQQHAPPAPLPTIFVTTLRKGMAQQYDYVLFPGCTAGAYPGPFLDTSLPLPATLFAQQQGDGALGVPVLPRPQDKVQHVDSMRGYFLHAVSSARVGVLATYIAPSASRPVSGTTGRSRFLDEIWGPPVPYSTTGGMNSGNGSKDVSINVSTFAASLLEPPAPLAEGPAPVGELRGDIQMNGRLKVSYSAISDYEWCPSRYRWSRVESVGQAPSTVLLYGVALHAATACAGEAIGGAVMAGLAGLLPGVLGYELTEDTSPFDIAAAALSLLLSLDGSVGAASSASASAAFPSSSAALNQLRQAILQALPSQQALEAHMRAYYAQSWVELEDRYSKRTWNAASAALLGPEAAPTAWRYTGPVDYFTASAPSYTHISAHKLGFSIKHLEALEASSALPAIHRVATLELGRLRYMLTDEGAQACKAGALYPSGPGGMPLGIPALIEKRFDLALESAPSGPVRVTGVIDRVDMTVQPCAPGLSSAGSKRRGAEKLVAADATAELSSAPAPAHDQYECVPLVREFKSSTQWKKDSEALRTQLRTSLQSDLYGVALHNMLLEKGKQEQGRLKQGGSLLPWSGSSVSVQLEGVETGQVEGKRVGPREMAMARARLLSACTSIRQGVFTPTPSEHKCTYCAYSKLCDVSFGQKPAVTVERLRHARRDTALALQEATQSLMPRSAVGDLSTGASQDSSVLSRSMRTILVLDQMEASLKASTA